MLETVKKRFKENHKSDGFSNPHYDHIIEEIYNLTSSIKSTNNQARAEKDGHALKDSVLPGAEFVQDANNKGDLE